MRSVLINQWLFQPRHKNKCPLCQSMLSHVHSEHEEVSPHNVQTVHLSEIADCGCTLVSTIEGMRPSLSTSDVKG